MKLTRSGYGLKALLVLICLGIQNGLLDAKAIKKSKHGVHKSGSKKNNAPKGNFCVNHSYCVKYSDLDCASEWVQLNCPRMCRLCEYEGADIMKLPAVLYFKQGNKKHGISGKKLKPKSKHAPKAKVIEKRDEGDRRDVVFLNKPYDYAPTKQSPTTTYNLFDYKSNYRNWLFLYPDEHPVHMRYVDQGKKADTNQQTAGQQQAGATQDAAGAPVAAAGAAAPMVAPAAPALAQPAAPVATAPVAPVLAQPAAPAAAAPGTAAAPVVPQEEQAAAAPVAAQQPVAAAEQPLAGAQAAFTNQSQVAAPVAENQTIELINQTVSLATNKTQQPVVGVGAVGFEPTVANVPQTNQAVTDGATVQEFEAGNDNSNKTVAAGNITSQNQSQSLDETQTFFIHQPNSSKPLAQLQSEAQTQSQATQPQSLDASVLHHEEASMVESLNTSPPRPPPLPSSLHASSEEVTSQNTLHVDNTDASSEMHGNLNPNAASVTLSGPGTVDLTTTGQSFTQDVMVDPDSAAQTPWTCCKNVKPPKDCKPCPKLPKAPPMPYVFNLYCNDVYKDCAYGYSNCNDTWWQINCPKTCGLCKAKDKVKAPTTKQILPKEVKDLENSELESDLVAPVPGDKPLVAKYTLRVKPKLLNGVPQMQEIRIMPPNKSGASGFVKPLMVLKQNITKPMIENIEIDVPKKGAKFSRKPSVEVIEGDHKEMLQVHKGQAIVEDPAIQKSNTETEAPQETKPVNEAEDAATVQSPSTPAAQQNTATTTIEQTQSSSATTTEQDAATQTSTDQTQSTSSAETSTAQTQSIPTTETSTAQTQSTPTTETSTAQTQSTPATDTSAQGTASYYPDTQYQSSVAAPATQTAAYSNTETCSDDSRCETYTENQCANAWLMENCKSKCKLC